MNTATHDELHSREGSIGYGDYLRFRALVHDRCGLYFPEKRRAELERGVRRAFAASMCKNLDEYYHLLHDPYNGAVHMEQLVNALTVGETHFFRDAAQFDVLFNHVVPQIIERRRVLRTLRIWSAGCASGEEPYSIAMLLRELLPDVDEWAITILGTDINTEVLDRARRASYSNWAFREERAKNCRPLYFRQRDNRYELIDEVKRMVTFTQLNLAEDKYPSYETNTMLMDLILCRNVMMYFTEPITRKIVERFYNGLTDGGWLVVGHAEHSLITYRQFQTHNYPDAILYRRSEDPQLMPHDWLWVDGQATKPPPQNVIETIDTKASLAKWISPKLPLEQPLTKTEPPPPTPPEKPSEIEEADPVERARELLMYGHSEDALDLLLELTEQGHTEPTIYSLLGQANANLGQWQEAEQWCRQAVEIDKLALEAYYTLALVLQHQDELGEAVEMMRKVVYIDRHYVLGHFGLANLYHHNGEVAQALKSLDNARRLLDSRADDDVVAGSSGITVGRLRGAIIRQQQSWSVSTPEM